MRRKKVLRLIFSIMSAFCLAACSVQPQNQTITKKHFSIQMGTYCSITLYLQEEDEEAVGRLEACIEALENETLSWRIETSELAQINAAANEGADCTVSEEMGNYLRQSLAVCAASGGALDISAAPVIWLWDIGGENARVPEQEEIDALLPLVGYEQISLSEDNILSMPQGMQLDLGAVGKGIACDELMEELENDGNITGAVISVGGSVLTYGTKQGKDWTIGIADPENTEAYAGTLEMGGGRYVSTSGGYERYITAEDGTVYHHILDPQTGWSAARNSYASVTVIADSGLLADALSTACFILEEDEGRALLAQYHAEAVFIYENGEIATTLGETEEIVWRQQ